MIIVFLMCLLTIINQWLLKIWHGETLIPNDTITLRPKTYLMK